MSNYAMGKERTLRTDSAKWINMVIYGTKKYENNDDYLRNNVKEMGNLLRKINLYCYSHNHTTEILIS